MKYYAVACCVALSSIASIGTSISANAASSIGCAAVAGTVTGSPGVKSATSAIQPASGSHVAYCNVNILYGTTAAQNINIVVGLPLNSVDGGTGGLQGAWNGRTQGLGGGVCAGNTTVTAATDTGYVGSGTDGGHGGIANDVLCANSFNADGTFSKEYINDFFRVGVVQEVLFSKAVAKSYYGMKPAYNYWNGCSTGGRQGYQVAQTIGNEIDGVLANAPAINWQRFATAQIWGEVAIKDLVHAQDVGPTAAISNAQFAYATSQAVAACDAADGVTDGIIDDPRICTYSAAHDRKAICVANGGTSSDANCLTPKQAQAIDLIWDGPRHSNGNRIWFPLDRGTDLSSLNGRPIFLAASPPFVSPTSPLVGQDPLLAWNENNIAFDWHTVTMFGAGGTKSYAQLAMDGSTVPFFGPSFSLADDVGTDGNLDDFRKHGGKMITFVGGNDQLIHPRGVINYYRLMASRYSRIGAFFDEVLDRDDGHDNGIGQVPDFRNLQSFYRLFRAPGVGHCGGGTGPQPQNLFDALVNWVEKGIEPKQIMAQGGVVPTRTRPLCPYPTTAIYKGSGSTDVATNFHCGGNLETFRTVCNDVVIKYKHENSSAQLDFRGTGVNRNICGLLGVSVSAQQ